MRFTRQGHYQAFKVDGNPCTSQVGLGIETTFRHGVDKYVVRRWLCASHRTLPEKLTKFQGRVRDPGDVGSVWEDCFVWDESYGPEEDRDARP